MKKIILCVFLIIVVSSQSRAQRFAYVDSRFILNHIPEYLSVEKQINALTEEWEKEVDAKYADVDRLVTSYQSDLVLLTPETKKIRELEIADKQKSAKEFQISKFGANGELEQRSNALIKPIQDRIAKAIQAIAENGDFAMIFDKNSEIIMLYADPRYDKSNEVLTRLGIKL